MATNIFPEKKNLFLSHLISFLYSVTLGYYLLIYEYQGGNYFYFYFIPYQSLLAKATTLLVVPIKIFIIVLCFATLLWLFKIERDFKHIFRKTLFVSSICYVYILLLTIEVDTANGVFFHPISHIEFPLRSVYVRVVILLSFLFIYLFIFASMINGSQSLGIYAIPLTYIPLSPFIFQFSPLAHFFLITLSILLFYFYSNLSFKYELFKNFTSERKLFGLLILIFIVACLFRLWTLHYVMLTNSPLVITDADDFYNNSVDLWNGNPVSQPSSNPSYSFLLFLFYKVAGFKLQNALTVSAILCSLTPILIFLISRAIFNFKIALIAATCTAFSEHLIHYSVMAHRNGLSSFFLTFTVFLFIKLIQKIRLNVAFFLGFFLGWTILLDGVLAPLTLLLIIPLLKSNRTIQVRKYLIVLILGFLIAQIPFNWVMYRDLKKIYPLGRDTAALVSQWNYAKHKEGEELRKMGFDPFISLTKSVKTVFNNPVKSTKLLYKKSYKEFKNYFLDHQAIILDPFLLSRETYFASSMQFYYFFILLFGAVMFFFSKKINWKYKIALGIPITYPLLFHCLFSMGTNRYRIVTQPLILILFAYGLFTIIEYFVSKDQNERKTNMIFNSSWLRIRLGPFILNKNLKLFGLGIGILLISTIFINNLKKMGNPFPAITNGPTRFIQRPWIVEEEDGRFKKAILFTESGIYDLAIKYAFDFGPSIVDTKLSFFMDKTFLETLSYPKHPGWLILRNIKLEKGLHYLFVALVLDSADYLKLYGKVEKKISGYNYTRKALGDNSFKTSNIRLMDVKMANIST